MQPKPTNPPNPAFEYALKQAYAALRARNKRLARRWGQQAAALAPEREEAWLVLASVASPQASIHYIQTALAINPESPRARKGMEWATARLQAAGAKAAAPVAVQAPPAARPTGEARTAVAARRPPAKPRRRSALVPVLGVFVFIGLIVAGWFSAPLLRQALAAPEFAAISIAELLNPSRPGSDGEPAAAAATDLPVPTETAAPLPTDTAEPTVTLLPSLTPRPTNTPTATPTVTPSPTATETPLPTNTPEPPPPTAVPPSAIRPEGVGKNENWIDIDLTNQVLYAYTGDTLIRSFVVSTGTWQTPTVTGTYKVYVKYSYADMSGPGYYLANVPWVMYFYQGYGIHGTYWHNNFGVPMSHGCVNMTIDDAGWMYDFSVVGTVVNIHY